MQGRSQQAVIRSRVASRRRQQLRDLHVVPQVIPEPTRTTLQETTSFSTTTRAITDRGFLYQVVMLPRTLERYERYRRNPMRSLFSLFSQQDQINIAFRFSREHGLVEAETALLDMIATLRHVFRIPDELRGTLVIEMYQPSEHFNSDTILGGDSSHAIPFQIASGATLFQRLIDFQQGHGYADVPIENMLLTFRFPLISFLQATLAGSCTQSPYGENPTHLEWEPDDNAWGLCDYDRFSISDKIRLGKAYARSIPPSLKTKRGLWLVPPYDHDAQTALDAEMALTLASTGLCGIMAFLYGLAYARHRMGLDSVMCREYFRSPNTLYIAALKLQQEHAFELPLTMASLNMLVETVAPDCSLYVYDSTCGCPFWSYKGSQVDGEASQLTGYRCGELTKPVWEKAFEKRICLYLDVGVRHYIPIFHLGLFFSKSYRPSRLLLEETEWMQRQSMIGRPRKKPKRFSKDQGYIKGNPRFPCPACHVMCKKVDLILHKCLCRVCQMCDQFFADICDFNRHQQSTDGQLFECPKCFSQMRTTECYTRHTMMSCNAYPKEECRRCFKKIDPNEMHVCKPRKCHRCKQDFLETFSFDEDGKGYFVAHKCTLKQKPKPNAKAYVQDVNEYAFDMESMLIPSRYGTLDILDPETHLPSSVQVSAHVVNLVCYRHIVEDDGRPLWTQCTDDLAGFWTAVVEISRYKSSVWFAHNLKGYDGRLLLDYLESRCIAPSMLVRSGDKIMTMEFMHPDKVLINNKPFRATITFRDSLLHLAGKRLSQIPAMFDLPPGLFVKGFFPYRFNRPGNEHYVGGIPPVEDFDIDKKSAQEKAEFMTWYKKMKKRGGYDLRKELKKYCMQDVAILKEGLLAYKKVAMAYTGISPLESMTLAQYTYKVYKQMHMPYDTLYYLDHSFYSFARRALHGGKTDVRRLYYEQTPDQKDQGIGLRYVDIQSLYPTVQYYDALPVGFPKTHYYDQQHQPDASTLISFFGFIECDIEPLVYMHHPLICDYQATKLIAHLYPIERAVMTSVEFQEAIQLGLYKCNHVHRIDMYQSSTSLFKESIRHFLKLKIANSGLPKTLHSDDDIEHYLQTLKERLDISLTVNDFVQNESLKQLAKMLLNSLWGKFGQRSTMTETSVLTNSKERMSYYRRQKKGVLFEKGTRLYGGLFEMKHYKRNFKLSNKNAAVAAFVTAQARLRLWRQLHLLGTRVYYHDTDSIIYLYDPNKYNIPEGHFLGDWESETGGSLITSFVGLAPKTYAYSYTKSDGQVVSIVKSKGFPVNQLTKSVINFDTYRDLLFNTIQTCVGLADSAKAPQIDVPVHMFNHVLDGEHKRMISYDAVKVLRFKYAKGVLDMATLMVYPFGYERFLNYHWIKPVFNSDTIRKQWNHNQKDNFAAMQRQLDLVYDNPTDCDVEPFRNTAEGYRSIFKAQLRLFKQQCPGDSELYQRISRVEEKMNDVALWDDEHTVFMTECIHELIDDMSHYRLASLPFTDVPDLDDERREEEEDSETGGDASDEDACFGDDDAEGVY